MDNILASEIRNKFINGFTRQRMRFKPFMPPIFLVEGNFSYSKVDLPLHLVYALVLWDMEDMSGTSKGPQ